MVTRRIVLLALAATLLAAPVSLVDARDDRSPAQNASKVDLNTAGVDELQTLPGIGPALARRIVEHRREHGPFRRVEDLLEVKGIGEKSLLRFRDLVTVSPSAKR
jgi:comEA protein